ncbi:hypothetical protein [Labrenzia sp. PHM005]|uniref:hypothetical protein n=1 Tax=Labrenzia sp. PHM005 TaxID=2590016 RepID=UPI00114065C5|nr:hypothetical protein [Labrenzia sp. PHM005]QDG77217.1 hypothetical protein FJ695_15790 [Labrenzia sp. PHM005]
MRVTIKSTDQQFQAISDQLQTNLSVRLQNAGDVGNPEPYDLLSSPGCAELLALDSYPQDFTVLGFAFKDSKDPAGQYPLRRILACTESNACISAGCDLSAGDVGQQVAVDLTAMSQIAKITTYYCQTASIDSKDTKRYGKRLVAFVISYLPAIQGNPQTDQLVAAPVGLFETAKNNVTQQLPLLDSIKREVDLYNQRNANSYQIFSQVNDTGLKLLVTAGQDTIRRTIVNLAYNQFTGKSRTYINNVSIISAIPKTAEVANLFQGLKEIRFDIPFVKNPLTFDTNLSLERSASDTAGSVTIYQNSSMHSFKIPSYKIAGVVDIGSMYSYSRGTTTTDQKQSSETEGYKNTIGFTVPANSYVVRGYPQTQKYDVATVIGLIYTDNGDPKFEISVPSGTPCVVATNDNALAAAILGFI